MKQNLISAKQDFDKYLHKNLSGKPKTSTHDSVTAKESQIKEILKESNETVNLPDQEQSNSIQDEGQSYNNNTLKSNKNGEEFLNEERDEDSLSSILSYINDKSEDHQEKYYDSLPSSSSSSSSEQSSSSSSTNNSLYSGDFSSDETNEDSVYDNIKRAVLKQKKKGRKMKDDENNIKKGHKLTSDKVCSQALQMIKFLGTLHMRKLDLKHEPRLRRIAFLEWISQLEIAFSSNKYTTKIGRAHV